MDLNIIVYENGRYCDEALIQKRISRVFHDRFHSVALSTIIEGEKTKNIPKPLKIHATNAKIKIYNRLTVKATQNMQIFNFQKNENFKHYDILAIEPMNEQTLNQVNSGDIQCDIVTFSSSDLSRCIKGSNFSLPIQRDVGIEINFGGMMSSSSKRRETIAFGQLLVDKTRGKNIVLSSGTRPEMTNKTPQDISSLAYLFGLAANKSKNALYENPRMVVQRAELRRNIVTSVIKVMDTTETKETNGDNLKRKGDNFTGQNNVKKVKC